VNATATRLGTQQLAVAITRRRGRLYLRLRHWGPADRWRALVDDLHERYPYYRDCRRLVDGSFSIADTARGRAALAGWLDRWVGEPDRIGGVACLLRRDGPLWGPRGGAER
jgi:hypothetical protein